MAGRVWKPDELRLVEREWGVAGVKELARQLERTERAVAEQAKRMGLGAPNRGRTTPFTIQQQYGYHSTRVLKACEHLGISFRRALSGPGVVDRRKAKGPRRRYVPEDRLQELLEFLARWPDGQRLFSPKGVRTGSMMWGTGGKPLACRCCGRSDLAHRSRGWCVNCAGREAMRERREKSRDKKSEAHCASPNLSAENAHGSERLEGLRQGS